MPAPYKSLEDAFFKYVTPTDLQDCWEWQGFINHQGYGKFGFGGMHFLSHRASWLIHHGKIELGKSVLHKCDNRRCVNPHHLFIGSRADNNHDMYSKGRQRHLVGKECHAAKLTEADVLEIRRLYVPYIMGTQRLANRFGVSKQQIQHIIHRKHWKHI